MMADTTIDFPFTIKVYRSTEGAGWCWDVFDKDNYILEQGYKPTKMGAYTAARAWIAKTHLANS